MKSMVDWSQAPHEILGLIAERVNSIEDYVRFGGVCQSWQSVILDQRCLKFSPKTLPWLMFPRRVDDELEDGSHIENPVFFNLSENKHYKSDLPEACNRVLIGSPHGWLILYAYERLEIYNPLTRVCIPLPLPYEDKDIYNYQFSRLVMPCSTTSSKVQFIVVVSFFDSLCFIRAGDVAWSVIKKPKFSVEDMVPLNNVVYILGIDGFIWCSNVTSPKPVITKFVQGPDKDKLKRENFTSTFHLVELLGELHLVVMYTDFRMRSKNHHFVTGSRAIDMNHVYYFRVFKLDFATKTWKELFTLGEYTIFVGRNPSISVRASDFSRCRRGCIYFVGSLRRCNADIGFFDLETHGMEVLFTVEDELGLCDFSVWFIPSLC